MAEQQADKQADKQAKQQDNNFPLFYQNPHPIDIDKHKDFGLVENFGLGYTKDVNAIPVNLIEMPQICHHYPIAFSPDESATPVAILGLRDNENLFLADNGQWQEHSYVPAYIRRYPFIFTEITGTDQLSLCVDMVDNIVSAAGTQKFFTDKGEPTELSKNALEFCKSYHAAAQQTMELSQYLVANDLLIERQAEINLFDNRRINFSGFRIVDEEKLTKLSDDQFLELRKKGWLPFIYAHLFSGVQWQNLTEMLNSRLQKQAA